MKRILALILSCALVVSTTLAVVTANAYEVYPTAEVQSTSADDFKYTVNDDGDIVIDGYLGNEKTVVVPESIDGHPVKSIGSHAFDNSMIKEITIPKSVESVSSAFYHCNDLEKVVFLTDENQTEGIKQIDRSFCGCTSLKSITIPKTIENIEKVYFGIAKLNVSPVCDENDPLNDLYEVEYDDPYVIWTFPFELYGKKGTAAEKWADKYSFITFVPVENDNDNDNDVQTTPADDFEYIVGDDGVTITGYRGKDESIVIPDIIEGKEVTEIAAFAFHRSTIEKVTLPETLVTIGYAAFCDTSVNEVTIPKSVKVIKDIAFGAYYYNVNTYPENGTDCYVDYSYGNFTMYGYVGTAADEYALKHAKVHFVPLECKDASTNCFDYKENDEGGITITKFHTNDLPDVIVIPETINGKPVTEIAEYASSYSYDEVDYDEIKDKKYDDFGFTPRTVILNEGLKKIGEGAFGYVYAKNVYIPSTVEYVGCSSFALKLNLLNVQIPEDEKIKDEFLYNLTVRITGTQEENDNITILSYDDEIDYYGQNDGLTEEGLKYCINDEGNIQILSYKGSSDEVYIDNYIDARIVVEISSYAFSHSDIKKVVLPYYLRRISYCAFFDCKNLQVVSFRTDENNYSNFQEINNYAFVGCTKLTSITLPCDIKTISKYSGLGVEKIEEHSCDTDNILRDLDYENANDIEPEKDTSDMPQNIVHDRYSDLYMFPFIIYGARGTAAQDYANTYETVTFIAIDEDDLVENYNNLKYMVDDYGKVIITGQTETADEVVIPNTISQYNNSFAKREVTVVDDKAFKDNKSIKKLSFDAKMYISGRMEGVKKIGNFAFAGCDKLDTIDFTNGNTSVNPIIKSIGECAFLDCKSLKSVTIPAGVEGIGDYAFGFVTKGDNKELIPDFVIYGYTGTAAEEYANKFGVKFESIGYKGFEYRFIERDTSIGINGLAEITAYKGIEDKVIIPETLDNAPVRIIGEGAFKNNSVVRNIEVPKTVMYIKDEAFRGCEQLQSFDRFYKGNYVHIGKYAFAECSNLMSIYLDDTIKYIGEKAFGFSSYTISDFDKEQIVNQEDTYKFYIISYGYKPVIVEYTKNNPNVVNDSYDIIRSYITLVGFLSEIDDPESDYYNPNYKIVMKGETPDHAVYDRRFIAEGEIPVIEDEIFVELQDYVLHIPVTEITETSFTTYSVDDKYETESVVIGRNITTIKENTFINKRGVTEYYIPASVEKIEDYAVGYSKYTYFETGDEPPYWYDYNTIPNIVIYGYENTEAERYADDNDITFFNLGKSDYKTSSGDIPSIPYLLGDVNGDGKITAKDSLIIQRCAIGLVRLELQEFLSADINEDGKVTTKDALEVLRYTIGIKSKYIPQYQ